MKSRVLVLGGTGYVGRNISSYLKSRGYNTVSLGSKDIDFLQNDSAELFAKEIDPDTPVIITAAITRTKGDTIETCLKNVAMMGNILKGLQKKQPAKVIYLSGADVYGRPTSNLKEDQAANPKNPYGIYKTFAEHILTQAIAPADLLILRLPGIFGGEGDATSIIARFINKIINDEEISLSNSGETLRDFVSMPLLQRVILKSLEDPLAGVYNLSCGASIRMKNLVSLIENALGRKANLVLKGEVNDRDFDLTLDCSAFLNKVDDIALDDIGEEIRAVLKER
jgi:nucleoside-diphosphate-sugar epimerase